MPARHLRVARPRRDRRRTTWARQNLTVTNIASGATVGTDLLTPLEAASSSTTGLTVIRTHLQFQVENWAAVADQLLFGVIVGRANDIGAPPASALSPANMQLNWMMWDALEPDSSGAAVSVAKIYHYDIKSMRKMPELNQHLVLSVINNSAAAKTYNIIVSVLVALP